MPSTEETKDNSSHEVKLDRATFLRAGLVAAGTFAMLGGASFVVLRHLTAAGIGSQMHYRYGDPLGESELRDRVDRFFRGIHRPDEE